MRVVLQRVTRAAVRVDNQIVGEIGGGLLVLLGVKTDDGIEDVNYLVEKIVNLRVFHDENDLMNVSLLEAVKDLLIVSQFTLYGDVRRGRRPSWSDAAPPERARELYELFVAEVRKIVEGSGGQVATGEFGAMMEVELINAGPVTLLIDSRKEF